MRKHIHVDVLEELAIQEINQLSVQAGTFYLERALALPVAVGGH